MWREMEGMHLVLLDLLDPLHPLVRLELVRRHDRLLRGEAEVVEPGRPAGPG
jgi:hypothetical protein